MSVKLMSMVFDAEINDMTAEDGRNVSASSAAFVLLALADHANDNGEYIYPSESLLAVKTKLSERTVKACMSALRINGYLTLKGKSKLGTNEYVMNIERLLVRSVAMTRDVSPCQNEVSPCHESSVTMTHNTSIKHKETLMQEQEKPATEKDELIEILRQAAKTPVYIGVDDEGNPIDSRRKPAVSSSEAYSIGLAIGEVCQLDFELNQTRIMKEAHKLAKKGVITPDDIRKLYSRGGPWYKMDWRGRQNQPPRPELIKETFVILRKTQEKLNNITGDVRDRR